MFTALSTVELLFVLVLGMIMGASGAIWIHHICSISPRIVLKTYYRIEHLVLDTRYNDGQGYWLWSLTAGKRNEYNTYGEARLNLQTKHEFDELTLFRIVKVTEELANEDRASGSQRKDRTQDPDSNDHQQSRPWKDIAPLDQGRPI